jgi:hypothetical protein
MDSGSRVGFIGVLFVLILTGCGERNEETSKSSKSENIVIPKPQAWHKLRIYFDAKTDRPHMDYEGTRCLLRSIGGTTDEKEWKFEFKADYLPPGKAWVLGQETKITSSLNGSLKKDNDQVHFKFAIDTIEPLDVIFMGIKPADSKEVVDEKVFKFQEGVHEIDFKGIIESWYEVEKDLEN